MASYSDEFKSNIIGKMTPPDSKSVMDIHRETGIPVQTLYSWKNQALHSGVPAVGSCRTPDRWSDESKLAVIIEAASLNEAELGEYCRGKGLYIEQIEQWRAAAVSGQSARLSAREREEFKAIKAELKRVKKELARKEKALAEAAALMVLRKKADAIFGVNEVD